MIALILPKIHTIYSLIQNLFRITFYKNYNNLELFRIMSNNLKHLLFNDIFGKCNEKFALHEITMYKKWFLLNQKINYLSKSLFSLYIMYCEDSGIKLESI